MIKSSSRVTISEWEENIAFDTDDPDFCARPADEDNINEVLYKVPSTMSVASVQAAHVPEFISLGRKSLSVSSSMSDLLGSSVDLSSATDTMLTIEDLRAQMGSCFTCGVSWSDDHVSLDCSECGGYSLSRPCPLCDGACGQQWKRDFTMSHASNKARWIGVCPRLQNNVLVQTPAAIVAAAATNNINNNNQSIRSSTNQFLAQELCARLEQLSHS